MLMLMPESKLGRAGIFGNVIFGALLFTPGDTCCGSHTHTLTHTFTRTWGIAIPRGGVNVHAPLPFGHKRLVAGKFLLQVSCRAIYIFI